jgi:hypothetical protein
MAFRVLDPLAEINSAQKGKSIRAVDSLIGKRLGLLWSQHASSEKFWPVFERVVEEVLKPVEVHRLYKQSSWNPAPPEELEPFLDKVDFVIVGVGGCGSCSTATVRDTVNVIRYGVPSVSIVHEPFAVLARMAVKQVGMPDAPVLIYPRDYVSYESEQDLIEKAHEVIERATPMLLAVGKNN